MRPFERPRTISRTVLTVSAIIFLFFVLYTYLASEIPCVGSEGKLRCDAAQQAVHDEPMEFIWI